MKVFTMLLLAFGWLLSACAQTEMTREEAIQKVCGAQEITFGPEYDRVTEIANKLGPIFRNIPGHETHLALVDSAEINAYNHNLSRSAALICLPLGIVKFIGSNDGELAFILAHEIGHGLDDVCKTDQGRFNITPPTIRGALDKLLGGAGRDAFAEQRRCEARADEIGLLILIKAGYSPWDAAGAFGRLEMFLGDSSTGVIARLVRMNDEHPMTPDRIRDMRRLLVQIASRQ